MDDDTWEADYSEVEAIILIQKKPVTVSDTIQLHLNLMAD